MTAEPSPLAPNTQPEVSVVVCTFNRADALGAMLEGLAAQTGIETLAWEVLIACDGSIDRTAEVARRFESRLPLRYLPGPHAGKSVTLNRACREARGDLLVFVDDDVLLEKTWLAALCSAAERRPDVTVFQGRIVNRWECPVPEWLDVTGAFRLRGVTVDGDYGDEEQPIEPVRFVGANAALRRFALVQVGDFRTDIGPGHPTAGLNEDTDLALRLEEFGHRCLYVPSATVHHPVPASRATQAYFKRWATAAGRSEARVFDSYWTTTKLFGMPRYAVRRYIEHRLRQLAYFLAGNRQASFYFKVRSWQLAAALQESRARGRSQR